jgi:hypothetical protein
MRLKAVEAIQTGEPKLIGRTIHECLLVSGGGVTLEAVEGSVPPHNAHKALLEGFSMKELLPTRVIVKKTHVLAFDEIIRCSQEMYIAPCGHEQRQV